ncbi:hypothetical protein F5890DRAFT_1488360 [Lentinula detonsa]|uniref:Secreted protein n=1 Tax=Lentinula detonsa TaxID=2804962 RepID=A0AA38UY25_9AGAR|nr:hypothetical protein F5890DRAFT_1488360 [Lentinula detonsa]
MCQFLILLFTSSTLQFLSIAIPLRDRISGQGVTRDLHCLSSSGYDSVSDPVFRARLAPLYHFVTCRVILALQWSSFQFPLRTGIYERCLKRLQGAQAFPQIFS